MEDRLHRLESRVTQLERAVRELQQCLDTAAAHSAGAKVPFSAFGLRGGREDTATPRGFRLQAGGEDALTSRGFRLPPSHEASADRRSFSGGGQADDSPSSQAAAVDTVPSSDVSGPLALAGRTFMIFAGAYLLRALVESGSLPTGVGVAGGVAYALAWLGWAARAAPRHAVAALAYGGAGVAIGYPLVWEATTRFRLLDPAASAVVLALVTAIALGVAWRASLHLLAWAATLASLAASAILLVQTGEVAPYAGFLVALGVATLWLGYDRDWFGPRWFAAVAADIAVLGVTSRALGGAGLERPAVALAMQALLLGGYLATIAARTLVRGRNVVPFEVAQTPAALAVGLGGAVAVARQTGAGGLALGAVALGIGAACYAVAFAFIDRRQGRGRNFYFYTSLGLVLTLTGAAVLLPPVALGAVWSLLAIASAWCGWRCSRVALTLHGVLYLIAAAGASGLLSVIEHALVGSASAPWPSLGATGWTVLVASAICLAIPGAAAKDAGIPIGRVPRMALGLLLVVAAGGVALAIVAPRIAGTPGGACDAGVLATVRTAVVSVAAVALALTRRTPRALELGWLLYPALVTGGLKLLAEDLRCSRASTLFVALALYGGALIIAPRLARTARPLGRDARTSAPAQHV
jgi:Predicted membrane protein (DUF2339)